MEFEQSTTGATLLRNLYAKLPCNELLTRSFANTIRFWSLGCDFCKRVAPHIPIRIPRVYVSAQRGSRFVLLLENLNKIPGVELFTNRDMASGTTPERPAGTVKAKSRFLNNIEDVDRYRIDLPCGNWKKASRGGYRSNEGVCRRVNIRLGKRVPAYCHDGKHLARFVYERGSLSLSLTLIVFAIEPPSTTSSRRTVHEKLDSGTGRGAFRANAQCPWASSGARLST